MAAGELIEVRRGERTIRFRACGGRIEATLRAGQFYEQPMLEYIAALARPGVYVDAGAYVGTHSIFFAAFCPATRVLAFEPRPNCLEHLRANIEQNQLGERIAVQPIGLSDRDETVTVTLDRRAVSFECRRLDDLVREPVAVMKLDVEGMESKVLAGAARVLERDRPLLYVEAHDAAALAALCAQLAPHGYRPTGRVFNHTATYELAVSEDGLPTSRSLLDPAFWRSAEPELSVAVAADRLHVESRLAAEQVGHVTAPPTTLKKPPSASYLAAPAGEALFVECNGVHSPGLGVSLYVMEYTGSERTHIQRHRFGKRNFVRLDLQPGTENVRLALRLVGSGSLDIDRLVLHTLVR